MGNVHMEATQINYRGGSKKMSVEDELDSLNSGLNNLKLTDIRRYATTPTDLNEIIPTRPLSLYQVGNMNNYTNRPTGAGVTGILLVMTLATYTLQLWISYDGMSIRYTFDGGTNWTSWTNVTMAS